MPRIAISERIELEYETFGDPAAPPLLMVMGFGSALNVWPRGFLQRLADGGRFVIAYDNRDCGRSSWLDDQPVELDAVVAALEAGEIERARGLAPYALSALAQDATALLDGLGLARAHVVGVSMGGMVAQTIAIEQPARVTTLTSMMSNTGEPEYGQPTEAALAALLKPAPRDRDSYIEAAADALLWRSRRWPALEEARKVAAESWDRGITPAGSQRQLAAMVVSGSRADGLRALTVPTLVIHGLDDTLIAPSGGERTAELVPGARLMTVKDMGHDRPEPLWPALCEAILGHTDG